ncbi:hypothetical protein ATN89_17405 [Comamonas thiooxydans]|uniref:hypothetical protein n=1 Tax=Comamonas thiooxydans TaxID=363952 RepID=UPI0007C4516F|nr:hypothetical protein [Comamonas thiooxydans]OAD82923.1 hypothetical protein ATN89_17405 [Comamonas thiooxydans]
MKNYLGHVGIALSQLWNTLWAGMPDETICSRAWRMKTAGSRKWGVFVAVVNALFFWQSNHCRGAYSAELAREHSPKALVATGK